MSKKTIQPNKFPYLQDLSEKYLIEPMPYLPLTLEREGNTKRVFGLVDSGSTVSVLPYKIGLELGAIWENERIPLSLTGNLANFEAKALFVNAQIEDFPPLNLAFAWTRAEYATLILGQTNFFMEFDVCFFRPDYTFELKKR